MKQYIRWLLMGILMFGTGAVSAQEEEEDEALKVGDVAPAFEAKADNGKVWKSTDYVGKKTMVVYFFPAAMTGG